MNVTVLLYLIILLILHPADPTGPGPCALILTGISAILILLTLPLSLIACVKVGGHSEGNDTEKDYLKL